MAYRRQETEWNHTASLLAKIHNMMAKTPIEVEQVHPMKSRGRANRRTGLSTSEFADIIDQMEGRTP